MSKIEIFGSGLVRELNFLYLVLLLISLLGILNNSKVSGSQLFDRIFKILNKNQQFGDL